jgi:radical SAM superfamily enzyme YgiQ (UPF0313 family)
MASGQATTTSSTDISRPIRKHRSREKLKILFINLPHHRRVQRRWVASYYAPNFLIPPIELMGLATLLRDVGGHTVKLIDAIASALTLSQTITVARTFQADLIVSLAGFEILPNDLEMLRSIGEASSSARTVIFGHLPSENAAEIAAHPGIDYVLSGEPEKTLLELSRQLSEGCSEPLMPGLVFIDSRGQLIAGPPASRIEDLEALPFPDHRLVNLDDYNEAFVPRPIGVVTSARGCPYSCSFCVRAYGRKMAFRSWQNLAAELRQLWEGGIRNVRFLDDTFTLERDRVEKLCRWLQVELPSLRWTCLTRLDRVDAKLAITMSEGGCRRAYVGIESGNPERLHDWQKGLSISDIRAGVNALKAAGIEVSGFFVVGAPGEDRAEVRASADFAAELDLDWVIVTQLQHWPGTGLFSESTPRKNTSSSARGRQGKGDPYSHERLFYRRFYLRPAWFAGRIRKLLSTPSDFLSSSRELLRYLSSARVDRDFI